MNQFTTLLLNNTATGSNTAILQSGSVKAVSSPNPSSGVNVDNFESIIDNISLELIAENLAQFQAGRNILPNNILNASALQGENQKLVPNNLSNNLNAVQTLLNSNIADGVSGQNLPNQALQQNNIINNLNITDAINSLNASNEATDKLLASKNIQNNSESLYSKQNIPSQILAPNDPLKEQSLKQIFSRLPQNYTADDNLVADGIDKNIAVQKLVSNQTNILQSAQDVQTLNKQNILASIAKGTSTDAEVLNKNIASVQEQITTSNSQSIAIPNINAGANSQNNNLSKYQPNMSNNMLANTNSSDFVNMQNSLNVADNDLKNEVSNTDGKNIQQTITQQTTAEHKTIEINSKSAEARPYTSASEQISLKINKALKNNDTKIEIQLDPAKLGKVSVNIELAKDGKSSVVIMVEKSDTLELLKADSKSLERALQNAGLSTDNNSLNFGLKGQNRQFSSYQNGNSSNNANNNAVLEDLDNLVNNESNYRGYQSNRALDIRA